MASLADYWPSSDDELAHPNTVSRQKGSNVQDQCTSSTSRVSTLKQRDLIPKSAVVTPVRKVRRLRSRVQDTNNPLFQPWSAEDDNGTQFRTQSTMRESFAKLSLDTDFSGDSPPTTTRSSRITAIRRMYPTRGEAGCPAPSRGNTLTPLATNKSENPNGPRSQVPDVGDDHTLSWARSSLLEGNGSDIKSPQHMSLETHMDSFGITDATVDGRSDYSYIDSHGHDDNTSNEAESIMEVAIPHPDSTASISSRAQHPVTSTYHREPKRNNATGPLQPLNRNVLSPNRQYIQQYNESTLSESQSAGKYLKSPDDEKQLFSKFEHMRLYSREVSAGDVPRSRDDLSDFITPPTSPQDTLSTPRRPKPVPQTPDNAAAPSTRSIREATRNGMKRNFKAIRQSLAEKFLLELDSKIANGQVTKLSESTGGVKIRWTKTLHTTAGRANWRREAVRTKPDDVTVDEKYRHHASIELAEKVVGDENRLLNVLAHEFCHLATFMISGVTTNPHGKEFKSWASKCSAVFSCRGVQVTTKHSYEIEFKYKWGCVKCGMEYQRHSKSIDTQRHRCGSCKGSLEQIRPKRPDIVTGDGRPAGQSEYQLFVKHHMKSVKEANPGVPQQGILGIIAKNWAELKKAKVIDHTSGDVSLGAQLDEADVVTKLVVDLTLEDS